MKTGKAETVPERAFEFALERYFGHVEGRRFMRPFATTLNAFALTLMTVGCSGGSASHASPQANLGRLGLLYGMYSGQHEGQPPSSIEEFKAFIEDRSSPGDLDAWGVSAVEDLFVSPRDGKAYQMVHYEQMPPPAGGSPPPVVFYETEGVRGKRLVAFLGGGTQEVEEGDLNHLVTKSP